MTWREFTVNRSEAGDLPTAVDVTRLDLHALWAAASRFAGYKLPTNPAGVPQMQVMVEIDPNASLTEREAIWALAHTPAIERDAAQAYVTGRLEPLELALLALLPGVARWRLGLAQVPQTSPRDSLVPFTLPAGLTAGRPWVGLIDHGVAFAQRAFRVPHRAQTRIVAFWDQEPGRVQAANNPGGQWQTPQQMGYGGCITGADIDSALAAAGGDEDRVYRALAYQPAQRRVSHGTHVLDLAAGYPNPLALRSAAASPWNGCAGHAPIIAVQLPYRPRKDTSGSGLGAQVLDALHFIAHGVPQNQRVVINLSDGAYGGRHDGRSMNEQAIDDFLRSHPQVELVLAAGNAGNQRLHACSQAPTEPGGRQSVRWQVLPDDATDSFCEIWFDQGLLAGQVELTVQPPQGLPAITVTLGEGRVWREPSSPHAQAAVLSTLDSQNHRGRCGFLVALGPTAQTFDRRPRVPHGAWRLTLHNTSGGSQQTAHVWIERDNPVGNDPGPRRQSHLEALVGGGMVIEGTRSLASLSGSAETFVVGGYGRRGDWPAGPGSSGQADVPPYVSRGPGRAVGSGPDVHAPCDDSPVAHGLLAAANRSGASFRMDGTSVAAPIVTRRLVNLIADGNPSRAQLKAQLGAGPARVKPGEEPAGSPCDGTSAA